MYEIEGNSKNNEWVLHLFVYMFWFIYEIFVWGCKEQVQVNRYIYFACAISIHTLNVTKLVSQDSCLLKCIIVIYCESLLPLVHVMQLFVLIEIISMRIVIMYIDLYYKIIYIYIYNIFKGAYRNNVSLFWTYFYAYGVKYFCEPSIKYNI